LLERVKATTLGAYAHQDVPFEQLVTELGVPRDLSRNPLVQVVFQLHNTPREELRLHGTTVTRAPIDMPVTTRFDLEIHLDQSPDGEIDGRLIYDLDLLDAAMMDGFADSYCRLLEHVAATEAPCSDRRTEERDRDGA
jgi:non-ribosomal peptide synthetase component F